MMAACPPHCPTPSPTTTLPSPPCQPNVRGNFYRKALVLKQRVDKMGACAAYGQTGSNMSHGKGWLGVLEEIGRMIRTNLWTLLFDLDDDDQEDARKDKRITQRWNIKLLQPHGQVMDILPYSWSPSTQQREFHIKTSAQGKQSKIFVLMDS